MRDFLALANGRSPSKGCGKSNRPRPLLIRRRAVSLRVLAAWLGTCSTGRANLVVRLVSARCAMLAPVMVIIADAVDSAGDVADRLCVRVMALGHDYMSGQTRLRFAEFTLFGMTCIFASQ